jgi:predicted nucleic acid-binding protein
MKQIKNKIFLDSNILIYLYSIDEPKKKSILEELVNTLDTIIISSQVLNEFINVMHKKRKITFDILAHGVKELCESFTVVGITVQTIEKALLIAHKHNYNYFDSLIIATALEHKCSILLTEDMHHNHTIENTLRLINPFK